MSDSRIESTVSDGVMTIQLLDPDMLCNSHNGAQGILSAAIEKAASSDVISLRAIDFLSSVGIGILLAIRSELLSGSRKLCLIEASRMVLEVTRLNRLLLIAGDELAARSLLNGES